jgi:hypothetical protein
MSAQQPPNAATSLITIHAVVNRGLAVAIKNAATFSENNFKDQTEREGYFNYVRALVILIDSHHLAEEEVAFPWLTERNIDGPYELLEKQHEEILPILAELNALREKCATAEQPRTCLAELEHALKTLQTLWDPHIQLEEETLSAEKLADILPSPEHIDLLQKIGEHSQAHSDPGYLVIPFILFNLEPQARIILSKGMPAELIEHMVPVVWKDQWASMKPFLLD